MLISAPGIHGWGGGGEDTGGKGGVKNQVCVTTVLLKPDHITESFFNRIK